MMLAIAISDDGAPTRTVQVPAPAMIGKAETCCVRLRNWRVARTHARLVLHADGVFVEDLGSFGGTQVNGRRIVQHGPLRPDDEIFIGASVLQVVQVVNDAAGAATLSTDLPIDSHVDDEVDRSRDFGADAAGVCRLAEPGPGGGQMPVPRPCRGGYQALELEWRRRLHAGLLDALDLRRRDVASMSDEMLREEADTRVRRLIDEAQAEIPATLDRDVLLRQVVDEAVGLGPLEALLADPGISEIMVNRHDQIYVEYAGRLRRHAAGFSSDKSVLGVIERIVAPLGRRIDESSPMVDARLRDGSRVNAIIPPLALKGPALTIRKFPARRMQMRDLVASGSLDAAMAFFLQCCVEQRKNVLVSGGTGSGKTTLLNILSNFIPAGERVITIEDAAELRLDHEHLVALEARPANLEGRGAVAIRDLVRNALRMRPDRIVVGECRGPEALDMLQAMNTGHEGSLTTLHANTPRDGIARLETMILMAGMDLPLPAIREQIASAVDIVVQQSRSAGGRRRVTAIVEVTGMESGRIQMQELFRYVRGAESEDGEQGNFKGCELMPSFIDEWRLAGVRLDPGLFCGVTAAPGGAAA